MSGPEDKDKDKRPDETPSAGEPGADKRSGRVAFDSRGNPIWEWQLETGVYSRDVSTQRLKKLDLGDLSIAETAQHKKPPGLGDDDKGGAGKKEPMPGGGFNPYDNTSSQGGGGSNPYDNARSAGSRIKPSPPPAAPQRKPADLRKLDAWIKLKKKFTGDKEED